MKPFLVGFATVLLALVLTPIDAVSVTWYVKADGTGDVSTIQDAVDTASDGDVVLLAAGTFVGAGNYDVNYNGKAITITSESGADVTIIDCQSNGRGFRFRSGEGSGSILSGLTIINASKNKGKDAAVEMNGTSPQILNNVFENNWIDGGGGAISIKKGSPTIRSNTFRNNSTDKKGGAIHINNSTAIVEFNIIDGNSALEEGGGIYIKVNNPTITNNTVINNSSSIGGGGIMVDGGATPMIDYNIVAFNASGEGVACMGASVPSMLCNDLFGNAGGDAICGIDLGNNNSTDPEFCGVAGTGNFYLQSDSPCTATNSVCGQLIGALPELCSAVATKEKSWGSVKALYGTQQ